MTSDVLHSLSSPIGGAWSTDVSLGGLHSVCENTQFISHRWLEQLVVSGIICAGDGVRGLWMLSDYQL